MAIMSSSSSSFVNIPTTAMQRTAARGAVLQGLSMSCTSLKNAGTAAGASRSGLLRASLLGTPLACSADEHKLGGLFTERRWAAGAGVVRASAIGVVQKVERASPIGVPHDVVYYNVVVTVPWGSELVQWYTTPGQYVDVIPADSQFDSSSSFFIASPPINRTNKSNAATLEFLIEDVPNTVANELVNSKPGSRIVITTNPWSNGFNMSQIEGADSVLMFASGYGLGPFRALIEKGFQANKKKDAILTTMFRKSEEPYLDRHGAWEATGVEVRRGLTEKPQVTDPTQTVVLMVASTVEQRKLAEYFERKGVPHENIQTLFDGIPVSDHAYYNKVTWKLTNYPKFLHSGPKNAAIELNI